MSVKPNFYLSNIKGVFKTNSDSKLDFLKISVIYFNRDMKENNDSTILSHVWKHLSTLQLFYEFIHLELFFFRLCLSLTFFVIFFSFSPCCTFLAVSVLILVSYWLLLHCQKRQVFLNTQKYTTITNTSV